MSKRAWMSFTVVQLLGCIFASYGTEYTTSAFVRASWLIGFLLLLPGNIPALAVNEPLTHVRAAYVFFPVAIACNAMLWVFVAAIWRMLRRETPRESQTYATALAGTGLLFMIVNTMHFLRRGTCADCFFPYGLPFTIYHDGGYQGGAGFNWLGVAADLVCVVGTALLVGQIWKVVKHPRLKH
jgi:hypothetical protein